MKTCPKLHGPFLLFLCPNPRSIRQVGSSPLHHTPSLHHRPERSRKGPVALRVPEPRGLGGLTPAHRHQCPTAHWHTHACAPIPARPGSQKLPPRLPQQGPCGSPDPLWPWSTRPPMPRLRKAPEPTGPRLPDSEFRAGAASRGWGGCSSAPESGFCSHLRGAPLTGAGAGAGARRPEQERGLLPRRGQPAQACMAPGLAATPGRGLSARGASASGVVSRPLSPRHGLGGSEQRGPVSRGTEQGSASPSSPARARRLSGRTGSDCARPEDGGAGRGRGAADAPRGYPDGGYSLESARGAPPEQSSGEATSARSRIAFAALGEDPVEAARWRERRPEPPAGFASPHSLC